VWIIEEKGEPPDHRKVIAALASDRPRTGADREVRSDYEEGKFAEFLSGFAAWKSWIDDLLDDAKFEAMGAEKRQAWSTPMPGATRPSTTRGAQRRDTCA